jgi:hypothetical protein
MIIVLDSNIWRSQLGLNSRVGTAVRFFIKERKARIALPEVIRLETEHHLRDVLNSYISEIKKGHRAVNVDRKENKRLRVQSPYINDRRQAISSDNDSTCGLGNNTYTFSGTITTPGKANDETGLHRVAEFVALLPR